ncbi:unnamed protein product [Brassica napus]|uniref:(rape) hypothetical protein n=1 Tax=Brassica napus TaxID=3708 RepID=A0A816YRW9_BRANA|nr:unnamed protein product [Brassica napus]
MGTAWFVWQDSSYQLLLLQDRENRIIKPAAWWDGDEETKDILGGRDEKTGGTWLGCSKQGRVAFLVNVTNQTSFTHTGAELLTVKFLKYLGSHDLDTGKMTTSEFANELASNKELSSGLTFNLVVADIASKSMVYISKKSPTKEVDEMIDPIGPGRYFITSAGIYDIFSSQDKHPKDKFSEVLDENKESPRREFYEKLMNDDQIIVPEGEGETDTSRTGPKGVCIGTTSIEVKRGTSNIGFNEYYWENNEFKEHKFHFDME